MRSAGSASQPSRSVTEARPRAAARKSAVRVFCAAEIQKSFFELSSLTEATKCPASRRAPSMVTQSARMSHHISRGACAMPCGSNVQTVPTRSRSARVTAYTSDLLDVSRTAPRARSTRGMAMPVDLPARGAIRSSSTSS